MNNKILEKLTFGFELEGGFEKGLDSILGETGRFKEDGSIHNLNTDILNGLQSQTINLRNPFLSCSKCKLKTEPGSGRLKMVKVCANHKSEYKNQLAYTGNNMASEYASPIFDDFSEMVKMLKLFKNNDNYVSNQTCGLHLHVGVKEKVLGSEIVTKSVLQYDDLGGVREGLRQETVQIKTKYWKKLYQTVQNWQLQNYLYKEALNDYCDCQKLRLTTNDRYCKVYPTRSDMVNASYGSNIKYSFMNFHRGYNTLEFRFFSPCQHKAENVYKLVSSLTDFLGEEANKNTYRLTETSKVEKKEDIIKPSLFKKDNKIEVVRTLFQDFPYTYIQKLYTNGKFSGYEGRFMEPNTLRPMSSLLKTWEIEKLRMVDPEFIRDSNVRQIYLYPPTTRHESTWTAHIKAGTGGGDANLTSFTN